MRKTVRQGNKESCEETVKGGARKTVKREHKENCKTGVGIKITNDTGVRGNRSGSVRQETRG